MVSTEIHETGVEYIERGKAGELVKILFCGTMVPEKIEYEVKDISAAGNRFQNNMIGNLKQMGHEVVCCTYLGMDIPEKESHTLRQRSVAGGQEHYVQKGGKILRSILEYRRLVRKAMDDTETVICYNITYAWLMLPVWARKKRNKSIVILADYSESVSYKNPLMKMYARMQRQSMRRFDTVVGLSPNIRRKLRKEQRFILMEGGIDRALLDAFRYRPHRKGQPVVILYSGLLSQVTGVDMLLEAMHQIKRQDICLVITGKGDLEQEVRQAAAKDERILFKGHLAYEEYVKQLQGADILVNPRNMDLPENQNNFPSKIMDYLASGKRIISTRFAGWERFQENIVFCDCDAQALGACMERALDIAADEAAVFRANRKMAGQFEWGVQLGRVLEQGIERSQHVL